MESFLDETAANLVDRLTVSNLNIVLKDLVLRPFHNAFRMELVEQFLQHLALNERFDFLATSDEELLSFFLIETLRSSNEVR